MINRQEILDFAREFGLAPNIVEKDYVLGWLLAGISRHPKLSAEWMFKGGTCLKKCYFETYRFSEDLDFTAVGPDTLDARFLTGTFKEIASWVYEAAGIEMPEDRIGFEVYTNPRGRQSVQGKVSYRGPMQPGGDLPRIKLDITSDEVLVFDPVQRKVHHPYSDQPQAGIHIASHAFEELMAEKIRALAERLRPRDLYDVVNIFRRVGEKTVDRAQVLACLEKKCEFKGIALPSMKSLEENESFPELRTEWENMLAHQLPVLPPFDEMWNELPEVFAWLYEAQEKAPLPALAVAGPTIDQTWQAPAMAVRWSANAPIEVIRFAAANRICVDLGYKGTRRRIEPYSLRRTLNGDLLLYAVKHDSGETRAYRLDRIESAEATGMPFVPRYAVELSPMGPVSALPTHRSDTRHGWRSSTRPRPRATRSISSSTGFGPTYVVECSYCGKKFSRKTSSTNLNPHKDKNGYPCPGRSGYLVETKY